jgi:YegS/Rv2252/BmrU family lipid kinase
MPEDTMIGIICNPTCALGKNRQRMDNVRRLLDEKGVEYEYQETQCPLDGIRLGKELSERCDTVIAVGGDGTVNEVLTGAYDSDVRFGILPFGTGNDVSRSLMIHKKTDEELVDMIMAGNYRDVDCGLFNGRPFMLLVSLGIVSDIIERFHALPKAGKATYPRVIMQCLSNQKTIHCHVILPDREFDCDADYLTIQNVPTSAGGLKTNPTGVDNDGHMELYILSHKSRGRVYGNALAMFRGKLAEQPNCEVIPVTEVKVKLDQRMTGAFDGDLIEFDEIDMKMGKKLKFLY